jgi:hypothetical protein
MKRRLLCLAIAFFHLAATAETQEINPLFGLEQESRSIVEEGVLIANPFTLLILGSFLEPTGLLRPLLGTAPLLFQFSMLGIISISHGRLVIAKNALIDFLKGNKDYDTNLVTGRITNKKTGFWIEAGRDITVMETRSKPSTVDEYQDNEKIISDLLFSPIKNFGLMPAWINGGGQYHMDVKSAFEGDEQLLRDFIVDLLNHPGFFVGGMGKAFWRAPVGGAYVKKVKEVIDLFDAGKIQGDLFNRLQEAGLKKMVAPIALRNLSGGKTIEFRSLRTQRSFYELIALMTLFKTKLNYLKQNPGVPWKDVKRSRNPYTSEMQFKEYVEEANLDWKDYERILPWWRQLMLKVTPRAQVVTCKSVFSN